MQCERARRWIVIGAAFLILLVVGQSGAMAQAPAATKPCQGTLTIGGQTYTLAQAVAYESKVFDDDVMISVLASDRPIAVNELQAALAKQGKDDDFSVWQPNTKVTFNKDGKPAFTNTWADNHSISVSGGDNLTGQLVVKDGRARGKAALKTDGGAFDFTFDLPLITLPKATATKPETAKPDAANPATPKPAATLAARAFPVPTDATNVEFKKLVEQINFEHTCNVSTMTTYLVQQLATRGWQGDPDDDLATPMSAILDRKQGDAKLTIFVKPSGSGCKVTVMTEGMKWD